MFAWANEINLIFLLFDTNCISAVIIASVMILTTHRVYPTLALETLMNPYKVPFYCLFFCKANEIKLYFLAVFYKLHFPWFSNRCPNDVSRPWLVSLCFQWPNDDLWLNRLTFDLKTSECVFFLRICIENESIFINLDGNSGFQRNWIKVYQ